MGSETAPAEPASADILGRTARGAGWMVAFRLLNRLLGLASILILVRLLAPEDFGLVALAFSFVAAFEAFTTLGLEAQLIRSKELGRDLYDTAFTLNVIRSLGLAVLLVAAAQPIADWFSEPRLETVLWALAGMTVLGGFNNVAVVDFMRRMDFRREFALRALPRLVQAVCGIAFAILMASHWALLLALLANTICSVVLSYALRPYVPRLTLVAWRALFSVSFWTWVLAITHMLRDRLDNLVIGRLLGPSQVGIYTVSVEISYLPMSEMVGPICRACGAGFAATIRADAREETAGAFRRILALTALVALPTAFGISLVAGPVVLIVLGPNWAEAAGLVSVLSLAYLPVSFGMVAGALLMAHLKVRQLCYVTGCAAIVRLALLFMVVPTFGLAGVGYGAGVAMLIENTVLVILALRATGLRARALLPHLWRPVTATFVMVLVLWVSGFGWAAAPNGVLEAVRELATVAVLGAGVYAATAMSLWFAAGRPASAERDMLVLFGRVAAAMFQRLRAVRVARQTRSSAQLATGGGPQ